VLSARSLQLAACSLQLAAALAAMGVQLDLHPPQPVCKAAVQSVCSAWQLKQLQDAATLEGASKLQHYTQGVCGGTLDAASLGTRAAYLTVMRERSRRALLAQLRTGSHWGAEEAGRWGKIPPEQRQCSHCGGAVETVQHMIFDCPDFLGTRKARVPAGSHTESVSCPQGGWGMQCVESAVVVQ
jgi:hypothetical protein